MNTTTIRLIRALFVVGLLPWICMAQERMLDPHDPASVDAEYSRVKELYRDDPKRLAEEMNKISRAVMVATGHGEEFDRKESIRKRYGPIGNSKEFIGHGGNSGLIVDLDAWRVRVEQSGAIRRIVAHLDSVRYKGAVPTGLRFVLRKASPPGGATREPTGEFSASLAYEALTGGQYKVEVAMSEAEVGSFVIQILADIEPGLSTESVVTLR